MRNSVFSRKVLASLLAVGIYGCGNYLDKIIEQNNESSGKDFVECEATGLEDVVCTAVYIPVCGDDDKTYSNSCVACINVESYREGKCEDSFPVNIINNANENPEVVSVNEGSEIVIAREECVASNGVWGYWGLSRQESCNLRTGDYGKMCYDNSECEGKCITECHTSDCFSNSGICTEFQRYYGCARFWHDKKADEFVLCID